MASVKAMRETVKATVMAQLMEMFANDRQDVGMSGSAELNFPVVLEDGTEDFIVVKVSIPTGSRDGSKYDGYDAREAYSEHKAEMAEKARKQAEEKARKIAKAKAKTE